MTTPRRATPEQLPLPLPSPSAASPHTTRTEVVLLLAQLLLSALPRGRAAAEVRDDAR